MFSKLVRIGKDAELRYTPNQKAVTSIICVYDIGWGENKKPQWIEVTLWGNQAEALAQYLTKGKQIVVHCDDLEVEEYPKSDGTTGSKLKARAINIELASGGQQQQPVPQQQGSHQQQAPQPGVNPNAQPGSSFDQPQQQGGFNQQPTPQQGGFNQGQQQAPQANMHPQKPQGQQMPTDFDDDIPF